MSKPTNDYIALLLAVATAISVLALVGAATYAIVLNTNDWVESHTPGPKISMLLATLIGSVLSAIIAGVVGYITGANAARRDTPDPGDDKTG